MSVGIWIFFLPKKGSYSLKALNGAANRHLCSLSSFYYVFSFINTGNTGIIQEKNMQNHQKAEWQQKKLILYISAFTDM